MRKTRSVTVSDSQYVVFNGTEYVVLISLNEYAVLDRKLDTPYPIKVDTPYRVIDQNSELRDNTFSGSDHEDANEHIDKVLKIFDLFYIPIITQDQVMLRAFPMSLTGAVSRWLRNKPSSSITTWEDLKTKFLSKYCLPARTVKKIEDINNFHQEPDETLYQAWDRFKELLKKCPQHYLTEMQETTADANVAIQEMVEHSQKWHNGTSRTRSTKTFDELAAVQAKLNNLGREIKKEEGKTLKEAYYTQFGGPFQRGGYRSATLGFYQRNNANPSYQERRQSMKETLNKFMSESGKRHEENSNMIKEILASTDAAIRNQGALIKTLEIQIEQISKVHQERGFGSLPRSNEANLRDHVKSISTNVKVDSNPMRHIGSHQYVEKDLWSFTLPCDINNVFFDNTLIDLGASVSVIPLLTYLNLSLGELAHAKLIVELADRTVKYPKGIAENVLVGIGKFVFPIDFIILDMPEDVKVPLILRRPFFSTVHAKIDVFKGKITLRVGDEKIFSKVLNPAQ
ncbi:hypothetical protein Tco_1217418 [Tanacetum coccineum]